MNKDHTRVLYFSCIFIYTSSLFAKNFATSIHQCCWGHYELYKGNKSVAWRLLHNVGTLEPQYDKFTLVGKAELLFENQQYKEIIKLYKHNKHYFDQKILLKKMYALSLAKLGKTKESETVFIELNKQHPTDTEIAFYTVNVYINNKELNNALQVIDNLLSHTNGHNSFIFYFLQAQIYLDMDNVTKAKVAIEHALKLNPDFDKAWLLFSIVAEKEQSWHKAIEGYNTFLSLQESSKVNQQLKRHVLELMLLQEKAAILNKTPNHLLDRFNQALSHIQHKNYKQALVCIEHCVEQEPHNKTYALLKIETLLHLKEYKQLTDYLSLLVSETSANNYWYLMINYITKKEKSFVTYAIRLLENLGNKNNTTPLLYLAHIHIEQKQWQKATPILKQLSVFLEDKPLACAVNHQLALLYFIQEEYNLVIETLKNNLLAFPNHIPSLNLLANAYIETKNIQKAAKIIAKARVIDTKNPHLMDTHAVVLFEQGQYAKAKDLLTKALALAPNDATIILHLAQVAHQEGDLVHAQELLEQGKKEAFYDHEHHMAKKLYTTWFPRQ